MRTFRIIPVSYITFRKLLLRLFYDSLITDSKNLFIFYGYMPYTIIEIISRCKNIMFNCTYCFRSHIRKRQLTCCFSFPVLMHFAKLLFCLLCNIKRICASCLHSIQLIFQPLIRKFRICLAASRRQCRTSHDQFIFPDNNGNVAKNMCKCFCPPCNNRFIFCCFIGFCKKSRSCRFNYRHMLIQVIYKSLNPVCFWNIRCMKSFHAAPFS